MICDRCGKQTISYSCSYFNTDLICPECESKERAHPEFEYAREIENKAVREGDYSFPGVGLPLDL